MDSLTVPRRRRLLELVVDALRNRELPSPGRSESEVEFTRRCLVPLLESVVREINFSGLVVVGQQGSVMISSHFLGANFYPDMAVRYFDRPVIAVEVKLLRNSQRQNSIATAIGQGVAYASKFEEPIVLLIDTHDKVSDREIDDACGWLARIGVSLVVRRVSRASGLRPHPLSPVTSTDG